jgi:hypothetical protein
MLCRAFNTILKGIIDMEQGKTPASGFDMSILMDKLYRQYITKEDQVLLDTLFAPAPSQEMLDECLKVCDIEVLGAYKALLFSYLMREHPELKFSPYEGPRLEGLIHFFRFANMKVLAHFSRIGHALNAAGIPVLIFKGAAMKALRPELSRRMGDVDVLVPEKHFSQTLRLCEELGYHDARTGAEHSVDLLDSDGVNAVDIHETFSFITVDYPFLNDLFARAKESKIFGVKTLLPCKEDLFTLMALNLGRNLRNKTSLHSLYFSLYDCRFLVTGTPAFNWDIVRENVRITKTEYQIRFAFEFMNTLVPGIMPADILKKYFPLKSKVKHLYDLDFINELVLPDKREACRKMLVRDLKREPRRCLGMLIKYVIIRKLRGFPPFARWFVRRKIRYLRKLSAR